jgi:hypothetical protein
MKKDFLKNAGRILALGSLVVSMNAFAGSEAVTGHSDVVGARGRATLTVEDLKTLLGVETRDPSSASRMEAKVARSEQEASDGAYRLIADLSANEKAKLASLIQKIEVEKAELLDRVEKDTKGKTAELRKSRRAIQVSRLGVGESRDSVLGKSLFESLLAEANLQARASNEVASFDSAHRIELDFEERAGARYVQTIHFGGKTVWTDKAVSIASK